MFEAMENELLEAFKTMHPTDKAIMLDHALKRAAAEVSRRPGLRLVASSSSPPHCPVFGRAPR